MDLLRKYFDIAFTPSVLERQQAAGSRSQMDSAHREWDAPVGLGPRERDHITARDSFYMATTSQTGWPYVQHRGGEPGFVKLLADNRLGWLERRGNRQYVGTGNLDAIDKVALILLDYPSRTRLKLFGHAQLHTELDPDLIDALDGADVRHDGAVTVDVVSFDWNCPKYLTPRFTEADVETATEPLRRRIAELEAELADRTAAIAGTVG